jgi:hypothetical protein
VSIFLTETSTRHSLLTKQKNFRAKSKKRLISNSSKITGDTNENAIEVDDGPTLRMEESEEGRIDLRNLPSADEEDSLFVEEGDPRRTGRSRGAVNIGPTPEASPGFNPLSKRREDVDIEDSGEPEDDKKKMAMDTSYEGFAIYGRVLCLVVKRRDKKGKGPASSGGGQAMMEDWIASTQMPLPEDDD